MIRLETWIVWTAILDWFGHKWIEKSDLFLIAKSGFSLVKRSAVIKIGVCLVFPFLQTTKLFFSHIQDRALKWNLFLMLL